MLLLLLILPRVLGDVSVQRHVYVSRKSRSNAEPTHSSYVYNEVSSGPGRTYYSTSRDGDVVEFGTHLADHAPADIHSEHVSSTYIDRAPRTWTPPLDTGTYDTSHSKPFYDSKIRSDALYEKLKSSMYYKPPDNDIPYTYMEPDYRVDDDDVRTSSIIGPYDNWPYFYHNPYEYEHNKIEAEINSAKDKRNIGDKIIPIHEDLSHDVPTPYRYQPLFTTDYVRDPITENPMIGHNAFYPVPINTYYNKNGGEDHFGFKGLDGQLGTGRVHDYTPVVHGYTGTNTLHESKYSIPQSFNTQHKLTANGESATEKGFDSKLLFDKHEKGNNEKEKSESKHEQRGDNYRGYKDFEDAFANKYGAEDHNKNSKYIIKTSQDKGENKKGFRRVYHKNEYQEEDEFFDNNNKNVLSEDKGSSNVHVGGSEAFLKSHANAVVGNNANSFSKLNEESKNKFLNNHSGHDSKAGHDGQYLKFADAAAQTALGHDKYYTDPYRI